MSRPKPPTYRTTNWHDDNAALARRDDVLRGAVEGVQQALAGAAWPRFWGAAVGHWWVITIHANSDNPVCYVLRLADVRSLATQDKNGGKWWLEPKACDRDEFREAWHRLESPKAGPASIAL